MSPAGGRKVRALVLTGFGINCEEEMAAGFRKAGAEAEILHLNRLFSGERKVSEFDVVSFPGGFSFGDDLGSGMVLADQLRFRRIPGGGCLLDGLAGFVAGGGIVIGICNGFQVLVKVGLLPNIGGRCDQEVTLSANDSGTFESRWVRLLRNRNSPTKLLGDLDLFDVPVRHGEGKLIIRDEGVRERIQKMSLNCLSYVDQEGVPTSRFPENPNGSDLECAGLVDPSGRVLGLMPHPEAFLSVYNHPDWPRMARENPGLGEEGEGLRMFRSIVAAANPAGDRKNEGGRR